MASISKVVAVWRRWYLFQVVVWLGAHLGLAGWLGGSLMFGGRQQSADGGWRMVHGGRRYMHGCRRRSYVRRPAAVGGADVRRPAVGSRALICSAVGGRRR